MKSNHIELSEKSIQQVIAICEKVGRALRNNQTSVDMARGIANYVEETGHSSEKQAVWICRNADYWKMKRPVELANIVIEKTRKPSAGIPALSNDVLKAILRRLGRIEKLLESRLH